MICANSNVGSHAVLLAHHIPSVSNKKSDEVVMRMLELSAKQTVQLLSNSLRFPENVRLRGGGFWGCRSTCLGSNFFYDYAFLYKVL